MLTEIEAEGDDFVAVAVAARAGVQVAACAGDAVGMFVGLAVGAESKGGADRSQIRGGLLDGGVDGSGVGQAEVICGNDTNDKGPAFVGVS